MKNVLIALLSSSSEYNALIAKYTNTVDTTEQNPENEDVILLTSELIELNNDKILAKITGIFATIIVLTIVI